MGARPARDGSAHAGLEGELAAAFAHVRSVELEQRPGARVLDLAEAVHTASGHFWLVDRGAHDVKIYAPTGRVLHVLRGGGRLADLVAPLSLAPVHGSWIAVLDAGAGRIAFYDERARRHGGFDLPQVEDPLQVRNLGDRHLAVVGSGSGRQADRLVHLYRLDGRHTESVFTISHRAVREMPVSGASEGARGPDPLRRSAPAPLAPQSAAVGHSILVAYAPAQSVVVYDFATRMVRSIPLEPASGPDRGRTLSGLFPAPQGSVVVMYDAQDPSAPAPYAYDLYDREGELLVKDARTQKRLIGVEGSLFYSIGAAEEGDGISLKVCRLRGLPRPP